MLDKKNIDRLFQEKFKDFEATPDAKIWEAIAATQQKKKKRFIPIWWFSSGVAAMFVLGLLLFPTIRNSYQEENEPVLIPNQTEKNKTKLTTSPKDIKITSSPSIIKASTPSYQGNAAIPSITTTSKSAALLTKNSYVVTKRKENQESESKKHNFISDEKIAMKKLSNHVTDTNTKVITKKEREEEKKDFIAEVSKKNVTKNDAKNNRKHWSIAPILGVVKANTFSQASAIDSNLNNNKVNGENSFSYGINVGYKLSEKWTLQSGVRMQKMLYNTQDVALVESSGINNNLNNVTFNTNATNYLFANSPESANSYFLTTNNDSNNYESGNLLQEVGYIEIPIEVKYKVITHKKINTYLVSGFSSLFLNQNAILVQTADTKQQIGEANNLNSINFSANLGLDISILLNQQLQFTVQPMFQTQLKTFSNSNNGFKPYAIGVYSGLQYQF